MSDSMSFQLRQLSCGLRFSLSLMVLILIGGVVVSGLYLVDHYEGRDGVEGLSMDDLRGAYHGVEKTAPMITVLENGHEDPAADEALADADRDLLLAWLRGSRISEDFDNSFDIATTTIGVLGWMPDLVKFFAVAARLLRSGGALFIYEQHPILDMIKPGAAGEPVSRRMKRPS